LCFDGHLYVFIVIGNTSGCLALSENLFTKDHENLLRPKTVWRLFNVTTTPPPHHHHHHHHHQQQQHNTPPSHHPDYSLAVCKAGLRKEIVYMKFQRKTFNLLVQFSPNVSACGSLLVSKNNYGSSHPCARKYRVSGWEVSKIKVLHLITDFIQTPIHRSSIHNIALHDLTFITSKTIVSRVMGKRSFLIRYSNGHTT